MLLMVLWITLCIYVPGLFFQLNTCDQNVARGCEIIELNAKVQGQLFKLLSVCAQDGTLFLHYLKKHTFHCVSKR